MKGKTFSKKPGSQTCESVVYLYSPWWWNALTVFADVHFLLNLKFVEIHSGSSSWLLYKSCIYLGIFIPLLGLGRVFIPIDFRIAFSTPRKAWLFLISTDARAELVESTGEGFTLNGKAIPNIKHQTRKTNIFLLSTDNLRSKQEVRIFWPSCLFFERRV